MNRDLADLLGKREIFWDLQEIAKENPGVLSPGSFFDWMCRNYMVAQTVLIRGFVDQSNYSQSLWSMLYEVLENPGVIDRLTHVKMYRSIGLEFGHSTFDSVAGKGRPCLSQTDIRRDLRDIENATSRVRRFVNKRIAHRTSPGEVRRLPKFNELDASLDLLDRIFCKYNLLFTGQCMASAHAVRQYDWRQVLRAPWVTKGSRFHPE